MVDLDGTGGMVPCDNYDDLDDIGSGGGLLPCGNQDTNLDYFPELDTLPTDFFTHLNPVNDPEKFAETRLLFTEKENLKKVEKGVFDFENTEYYQQYCNNKKMASLVEKLFEGADMTVHTFEFPFKTNVTVYNMSNIPKFDELVMARLSVPGNWVVGNNIYSSVYESDQQDAHDLSLDLLMESKYDFSYIAHSLRIPLRKNVYELEPKKSHKTGHVIPMIYLKDVELINNKNLIRSYSSQKSLERGLVRYIKQLGK
mgnify:FL=1